MPEQSPIQPLIDKLNDLIGISDAVTSEVTTAIKTFVKTKFDDDKAIVDELQKMTGLPTFRYCSHETKHIFNMAIQMLKPGA